MLFFFGLYLNGYSYFESGPTILGIFTSSLISAVVMIHAISLKDRITSFFFVSMKRFSAYLIPEEF